MNREQRNHAKVEAGLKAANAHDLDKLLDVFAPAYALYDVRQPEALVGPGEVRLYFERLLAAFPDLHLEEVQRKASGYMVYQELVLRGTNRGAIELIEGVTLPATNKKVELSVEVCHHFDATGAFTSTVAYASLDALTQQLDLK